MAGILGFAVTNLAAPVVRRIALSSMDALRKFAWWMTVNTATYVVVDKVTDYVLGSEEDSLPENALDLLLSYFLMSKGRRSAASIREIARRLKYDNKKRGQFLASLGPIPWFDFSSMAGKAFKPFRRRKVDLEWVWSEARQTLSLIGKASGRAYGHVSNKGISIPGVKLDPAWRVRVGQATGGLTLGSLSVVALDILQDQILTVIDESIDIESIIDSRDLGDIVQGDYEDNVLAFIRDPDVMLRQFGSSETAPGILVDRAVAWLQNAGSSNHVITAVDDSNEYSALVVDPNQSEGDRILHEETVLPTIPVEELDAKEKKAVDAYKAMYGGQGADLRAVITRTSVANRIAGYRQSVEDNEIKYEEMEAIDASKPKEEVHVSLVSSDDLVSASRDAGIELRPKSGSWQSGYSAAYLDKDLF